MIKGIVFILLAVLASGFFGFMLANVTSDIKEEEMHESKSNIDD